MTGFTFLNRIPHYTHSYIFFPEIVSKTEAKAIQVPLKSLLLKESQWIMQADAPYISKRTLLQILLSTISSVTTSAGLEKASLATFFTLFFAWRTPQNKVARVNVRATDVTKKTNYQYPQISSAAHYETRIRCRFRDISARHERNSSTISRCQELWQWQFCFPKCVMGARTAQHDFMVLFFSCIN